MSYLFTSMHLPCTNQTARLCDPFQNSTITQNTTQYNRLFYIDVQYIEQIISFRQPHFFCSLCFLPFFVENVLFLFYRKSPYQMDCELWKFWSNVIFSVSFVSIISFDLNVDYFNIVYVCVRVYVCVCVRVITQSILCCTPKSKRRKKWNHLLFVLVFSFFNLQNYGRINSFDENAN